MLTALQPQPFNKYSSSSGCPKLGLKKTQTKASPRCSPSALKKEPTWRIGIDLRISGKPEWSASEERHSLEKAFLSKIGYKTGLLFQEKGIDWNDPTKENLGSKEWLVCIEQIFQDYAFTMTWERTCIQAQHGLWNILIQMGSKFITGQWPALLNAEVKFNNTFTTCWYTSSL